MGKLAIRSVAVSLAIVTVAVLVPSCSDPDPSGGSKPGGSRSEALAQIADEVIVPGVESLATSTSVLAKSVSALCGRPDRSTLEEARDRWSSAQSAWMRASAYFLGPVGALHTRAQIGYPVDTAKVDKLFSPGSQLPDPPTRSYVESLGADVRGLGAIEYLLFEPEGPDVLDEPRCEYAHAAAQSVASGAEALRAAWITGSDALESDTPFVEQFKHPGKESMYDSEQEAVNDLVNVLLASLNTIGDMILGPASGRTGGAIDRAKADPGAAHNALNDAIAILEGIRDVYGTGSARISGMVEAQSKSTDESMRNALEELARDLKGINGPLRDLDTTDDDAIATIAEAFDAVSRARVILRTEVASQLGVTVGFSDSDGDS